MGKKITFFFTKEYPQSFVSYKDYIRQIIYALRRAGIDFVFSEGYHPRPIIYSVYSLSLGVESNIEPISAEIASKNINEDRLKSVMPYGISYLGYIDGYIERYIALYRKGKTYFILKHPEMGLGRFLKEKEIPPYEIIKEDVIVEGLGSMKYYLGVK